MKRFLVLGLCLVYATLVTAGFFTPSPGKHNSKDDVRVNKEGVVIGIEEEDGNTRVSISPRDSHDQVDPHEKGFFANAREKIEKASSSVLPEVMKKGGDSANQEEEIHHKFRPGEVVCDAYGRCKEKINSYMHMGRTKEAAEKAASETVEKAFKAEEEAKEAVKEGTDKVKDGVSRTAQKASDKSHVSKENVKAAASEGSSKVKDKMREKASEMKEGAKEKVTETAKAAEERVKTKGKNGLQRVLGYIVSPLRRVSLSSVLHLLGFATAYGMCVWVTFASNYVLARALPRHQLAMVQSKMYPVYFKAMASSVGIALAGHLMDQKRRFWPLGLGIFRGFHLWSSLVMILVNLLYLEPRATKVLFERMKKEKEEGDATVPTGSTEGLTTAGGGTATTGEKQEEAAAAGKLQNLRPLLPLLRRLNSYSSLLNIATLMSLTWHLLHLGHHLHGVC